MKRIKRFEWDARNAGHIAERHGLSPDEAEEVFFHSPVVRRVRGGRFAAYGQTGEGRYLTVIFYLKPGGVVRVVTARDMNRWERCYYRERRRGQP
ncbi:BrnT family toxin [Desulfothermobacter acidiphilus]|uniref:BrnT family toxin n=1 Tax=Desulfothermobacter acidiphilus TaxID=1938353 RepID=UPI003F89BE24